MKVEIFMFRKPFVVGIELELAMILIEKNKENGGFNIFSNFIQDHVTNSTMFNERLRTTKTDYEMAYLFTKQCMKRIILRRLCFENGVTTLKMQ